MSQPKRYDHRDCNWVGKSMIEHPQGEWVKWDDYAALAAENFSLWADKGHLTAESATLAAENERLKSKYEIVSLKEDGSVSYACQDKEIARLKAENERLCEENVVMKMERMQDKNGKRITYADYAAAVAEVERLRKAVEWQPIETAPAGKQVLVYAHDYVQDRDNITVMPVGFLNHITAKSMGWTHWMPIPSTFAAKEGGDAK